MKPVRPTVRRGPWRLALALLLAAAFAALTVAPAQAAAYRYWSFYQQTDAKWVFAQKGSDQTTPKDGSVEGWRFAVGDASSSRLPRATPTFAQICADTPAQEGKKRVGLVQTGFPTQSDDENYLGESWRDLLDAGVEAVTLRENDVAVYGPMSLRTAE